MFLLEHPEVRQKLDAALRQKLGLGAEAKPVAAEAGLNALATGAA
jgi:hypothetical protein